MIIFKKARALAGYLQGHRSAGTRIGFVPTMGALHPGHISLIEISKSSCGLTACSIFVNPTQFNDPRDFQKYPVTIEKDIELLEKAGTDILFLPSPDELYPGGTKDLEKYDLGRLEEILEGKYRPGHFQGVAQVMRRLLDAVQPQDLFMGQKDYQQCMVVSRLLSLMGSATVLHTCPILREPDGLAMSSRNLRLTESDRKKAPVIYEALSWIKDNFGLAPVGELKGHARGMLEKSDLRIDYVEIADAVSLEPLAEGGIGTDPGGVGGAIRPEERAGPGGVVALVAAFQGEVRLIDNMVL
ncbi:MAG TPA: pantoate--beta-alanine ligase [Puia sp.]|nr:pantoate--beta-alanine ligase [Puia sp.]